MHQIVTLYTHIHKHTCLSYQLQSFILFRLPTNINKLGSATVTRQWFLFYLYYNLAFYLYHNTKRLKTLPKLPLAQRNKVQTSRPSPIGPLGTSTIPQTLRYPVTRDAPVLLTSCQPFHLQCPSSSASRYCPLSSSRNALFSALLLF